MHNAPHDLRDYILDELTSAQQGEVETWLAGSPSGRAELERLRLTFGALRSLPDEEPPRRIAFVSDKIFEPSPWARFLRWFHVEGPRFALGSAAVLAVLFAGLWATEPRVTATADGWTLAFGNEAPATAPVPSTPAPVVDEAAIQARIDAAVAADREQMRAELAQSFGAMIDERARKTEAKFSSQLEGTREDLGSSLYLINTKYEQLMKDLSETKFARAE
ncbi:MAG: hypothetical protein KDC27_06170 [Acidobacteria bacterium]|nr:hypothetical protein [Acidobacteriota bacterium]